MRSGQIEYNDIACVVTVAISFHNLNLNCPHLFAVILIYCNGMQIYPNEIDFEIKFCYYRSTKQKTRKIIDSRNKHAYRFTCIKLYRVLFIDNKRCLIVKERPIVYSNLDSFMVYKQFSAGYYVSK